MQSAKKPLAKVVVVDDQVDVADSLATILEASGFEVRTAYSGAEAVRLIEANEPDMVVSDLEMPGMSGFQEATEVRALPLNRQPWMVAVSGMGQPSVAIEALVAGFDHFMPKPTDIAALLALLKGIARGVRRGLE